MTYRQARKQQYSIARKYGVRSTLRSTAATATINPQRNRAIQSNITGLALFLAKFLSGKGNITVSTDKYSGGYAISKTAKGYDIVVPDWETYILPLNDKDKYRIYRSGVWHESCHARFTPEGVFTFGTDRVKVTEPLVHDVINILEDRRIEDLGVTQWKGYVPERIFTNAYAWSRRMDVGEFWNTFLKQHFDENKGEYTLDDLYVRTRKANMRHEAFLQRLLVGKIKGERIIPAVERDKIERAAKKVEEEYAKLENKDDKTIFGRLAYLTNKVINDLELKYWQPPITQVGESSWDQTFKPKPPLPGKDKQEVKAGIDDYFDEIMNVEFVCEKCGKHYARKFGVRED